MKKERTYTRKEIIDVCRFVFSSIAIAQGFSPDYVNKMIKSVNTYLDNKEKGL